MRFVRALFGICVLAVVLPGAALAAGAPSANMGPYSATVTGLTTATVDGAVNPAGQTTTYKVEYDLASSTWCTSYGGSGSPSSTASQTLGYTDTTFHDVSVALSGLSAGTGYCADLVATNGSGSAHSGQTSFTAGAPSVYTYIATVTGLTTATVDGAVNPTGQATAYAVEYALASSDWCTSNGWSGSPTHTTSGDSFSYTDGTDHDVTVALTGLTAGTSYCADLVATNGSGSAHSGQTSFTAGAPSVYTYGATATGATTASVRGSVNPTGQTTTYKVEYDLASSTWCTSYGGSGSPSSTAPQTLGSTDTTFHDVSVDLTGLTAGTGYCADLVATNGSGSSAHGYQVPFTAGAPSANTYSATVTGATTATVDGAVNPAGQTTTYKVEYDLASSTWCTSYGGSGSPSSTASQTLGYTDTTFHDVSVALSGLSAGTGYCADLVATNGSGSAHSGQTSFTAGAPSVYTWGATVTGLTTATVYGGVNPNGQATAYAVEYALASSDWCTSNGWSGSPTHTTSGDSFSYTDGTDHVVTVDLTGLTAGTGYCADLVATNGTGSAHGYQVPFTAGAPSVSMYGATATGATTASVRGSVNPTGQTTTYKVEYDLASSTWCTSYGSSGSPSSTAPQTLGSTDTTFHDVTVALTGLTAGTGYCADLVATNGSGSAHGYQVPFTAGAPSANTYGATATGATTASVRGSVNPTGQTTTYKVEYDLASSTWCTSGGSSGSPSSTTAQTLGFTDATDHDVTVALSGLTAGTDYCADLVASNGSASVDGGQRSFTAGAPSVSMYGATATGTTTTRVDGSVNPNGQATAYAVEYALASSDWCTSNGWSGSPTHTTSGDSFSYTDGTDHDVTVALTGLTAGTSYCADLVATNGTGSENSDQTSFTAGAPSVYTYGATVTGLTTATVDGGVNPTGQTTTYKVEYDLASSTWCTSYGWLGSPASSTTAQTLGSTDATFHDVSVDLTGLSAGTGYCADLVATNGSGSAHGYQVPFTAGAGFHSLTVSLGGAGSGSVSGTGINCPGTCSDGYPTGTMVTLTATPAAGSVFAGWSGGGCSGTGSCQVTVNDDTTVTATFTIATHNLTVSKSGAGTGTVTSSPAGIDCGSTCVSAFNSGTSVTLTAAPAAGSFFAGWSGGGCSGTSSCQVTVNADTTVTATFNPIPPNLTVSKSGAGTGTVTSSPAGIDCGSTCVSAFNSGTSVTLTAAPAAGSFFAGWSGGGCSGTGSCQVTVNGDTTVTATFAITVTIATTTHNLTVSKSGAGTGTVTSSPAGIDCGSTCVSAFNSGTSVTLTAAPAAGSFFAGWSGGGCSGSGSCALTLNADTTVAATFTKVPPVVPSVVVSVQTRITKATINSRKRMATFRFRGSGGVKPYRFQCKLDKKKYSSCRSGKTYKHLKPGKHTFRVRAKDHAGRLDKTPAIKKFKIKH